MRYAHIVATIKPVIVWDEAKRKINLQKHRLDFADAHIVYDNPNKVTYTSYRNNEARRMDIAIIEHRDAVLSLVYIERDEDIRVISFRTASRKERKIYERDRLGVH